MDAKLIFPLALFLLFVCTEASVCNPGWYIYDDTCYKYSNVTSDVRMARKYCQLFDGDLATVRRSSYFLARFDQSNKYRINEDSVQPSTIYTTISDGSSTSPPSGYCPYLHQQNVEFSDCNEELPFICETSQNTAHECPQDWFIYNSSCFLPTESPSTFVGSVSLCSAKNGGQVAILDDGVKEQGAQAMIIGRDEIFFVGALRENGEFKWLSGQPFNPSCSVCTDFGSAETGECLGIKSSSSHPTMFEWVRVDCNASHLMLCETDVYVVNSTQAPNTTTESTSTTERVRPLSCPIGHNWKAYRNSNFCFWETTYETDRLNWFQARQFCQAYGGDLATYRDSSEEDHGLGGAKGHYKGLWFGLQRGEDDVFHWVDATPITYTNWDYIEPNLNSQTKYCASHSAGTGRWELDYCGVRRWFVCKAPKVQHPTLPSPTFRQTPCNFSSSSRYRWFLYNNHCYHVNEDPKYSWDLALNFCRDNEAHLASIHSFNETNFILLAGSISSGENYWIGLSAKGLGSSFTWSDGSPLDFTYWNAAMNGTNPVNTCVSFDPQRGFWSLSHCNRLHGVVCKRGLNSSFDFPTQEPTPLLPGNCQSGWFLLGNQCYRGFGKMRSQRVTWTEAQRGCENENASLASVHNEEQQNFLTDLLIEIGFDAWIGMESLHSGTLFRWVDETAFEYSNWNAFQPSGSTSEESSMFISGRSSDRSCVVMEFNKDSLGKWNDLSCSLKKAYICQKPKDPSLTIPSDDLFKCPDVPGWSRLGSSCFGFFETKERASWIAAQGKCRAQESNLVSFENLAIPVFLAKRLKKNEFFWTGIRETERSKYTGMKGRNLVYSNWLNGQPKTVSSLMDNCVAMNSEAKWMIRSCQEKLPFVCEWTAEGEKEVVADETHLCPNAYSWKDTGGDLCVKTFYLRKSWNSALYYCFQHGGSLAAFHSQKDLNSFVEYVRANHHYTSVLIGLARRVDGSYMWADYSPVDFTAWDPDDPESVTKNCVELDINTALWKKIDCDDSIRNYFCSALKKKGSDEDESVSGWTQENDSSNISIGGISGIIICLTLVLAVIGIIYYLRLPRQTGNKLVDQDAHETL